MSYALAARPKRDERGALYQPAGGQGKGRGRGRGRSAAPQHQCHPYQHHQRAEQGYRGDFLVKHQGAKSQRDDRINQRVGADFLRRDVRQQVGIAVHRNDAAKHHEVAQSQQRLQ